jgi:hypothetical protein
MYKRQSPTRPKRNSQRDFCLVAQSLNIQQAHRYRPPGTWPFDLPIRSAEDIYTAILAYGPQEIALADKPGAGNEDRRGSWPEPFLT